METNLTQFSPNECQHEIFFICDDKILGDLRAVMLE